MKSGSPRVLIADDQADVLEALRLLLKAEGYHIETVRSPKFITEAVEAREFDVVLMDLNYTRDTTSGEEGMEVVARVNAIDSTLPVIVMTAWGSIELAVEAMRRGARDFVQKPWENPRLLNILRTQIELGRSLRKERRLEAENQLLRAEDRPAFIAQAPAMQPMLQLMSRVGPSDANILITDRKSTRLNSSHLGISYAVFCLKKKKTIAGESPYVGRSEVSFLFLQIKNLMSPYFSAVHIVCPRVHHFRPVSL